MKKLAMLLGCGMVAFAIGCGDGGGGTPSSAPPNMTPDPAKMKDMMDKSAPGGVAPATGAEAPADGEKKEGDAPAEKKEGDAPAEKKEGDAPAEKKE